MDWGSVFWVTLQDSKYFVILEGDPEDWSPVNTLQQLTGVTLQDSKIFTQEQTKNLPFWTETSSKIGKAAFASC